MFEQTKSHRYTAELHTDIKGVIPKYASLYKAIERVNVVKTSEEAVLLALAVKIDTLETTFTEVKDICLRYFPADAKKKKQKTDV